MKSNTTLIDGGKSLICRYAYPWWKEKVIDSDLKRKEGLCPLTPEETAQMLRALGVDPNVQIYIAAGEIYGGERRLASLATAFPNLVSTRKQISFFFFYSLWICHSNLLEYGTGQKGETVRAFRLEVFSEPLIPNGCIGLSRLVGE